MSRLNIMGLNSFRYYHVDNYRTSIQAYSNRNNKRIYAAFNIRILNSFAGSNKQYNQPFIYSTMEQKSPE